MGGYIALNFSLCYPERVDVMILVGSNSGPPLEATRKRSEEAASKIIKSNGTDAAMKYIKAHEAYVDRPDLSGRLSEIRMPILIIVGDRDIAEPVHISKEMHRRILNSQLEVIRDCGHRCNEEQPDIFNCIVNDFLQSVLAV